MPEGAVLDEPRPQSAVTSPPAPEDLDAIYAPPTDTGDEEDVAPSLPEPNSDLDSVYAPPATPTPLPSATPDLDSIYAIPDTSETQKAVSEAPDLGPYDTPLSPGDEAAFQKWKSIYAPRDSGMDYDLRGAFKAGLRPDPETGHWPDTYKKPNHPTFSNQSQYATGRNAALAGHWDENGKFIPPVRSIVIPRAGTMGVETELFGLDKKTPTPEWYNNAVEAAGEVAIGFVPRSPHDVAAFLSPLVPAYDQARQTVNTVRDFLDGSPLDQATLKNYPDIEEYEKAIRTAPFSKERFKVAFNVTAQMGTAAAMAHGVSTPKGGEPNATQKGNIQESIPAKLEDRTAGGQAEETGVSDRLQPAASQPTQEPITPSLPAIEGGETPTVAAGQDIPAATTQEPIGVTATLAELDRRNGRAPQLPTPLNKGLGASPEILPRAPEADVPSHLKHAPDVEKILAEQPLPDKMVAPEAPPEGGSLGSGGGKRAKIPSLGTTPTGDKNFLRIPSALKRVGKGLFTEGARHQLARQKNKIAQALAKAVRRHVDLEQELYGMHEKILRDAMKPIKSRQRLDGAFAEVGSYVQDVENGRPTSPLQPDAQRILDAWYEIGEKTGDIARANGVQVWDAALGKYRPMGKVPNYIPRMFKTEVEAVLRDPKSDPVLFQQLADEIAKLRGITSEEAAAELRGVSGRFTANDYMSNLEMARTEALPEIFYEYDLRRLISRYLPSFSERMAQIIAFGQRLGTREVPIKQNLWDIARREAEDVDSQQWLNAAEDQATGFKHGDPINRVARRAQALGNAFLLSDPTTTVVRNFLSGLAVTTERYGVLRSGKAMIELARMASHIDPREVGVLRDDIGTFLGAQELGTSKLDNFIREFQSNALTISGFSPSEVAVRTHGAITASQFARDAAKAIAKNPASRLSKEALAHFKRTDVDPVKIVQEGGDWRNGPETRKYIRTSVRDSQGGYRYDQVPLWAGTTAGRFLYQYGRWSIQRAGDILLNTIRPAIGETVEYNGQRMTRRNVLPLMRLGFLTVGLGETFTAIASALFSRDRKDASFDEIQEEFQNGDQMKAVGMAGERVVNDIIAAGTLGLLSQPIDFIKATKDQSRFKNPADPPSLFGISAILSLAQKAYDQGGSLTRRDLVDFARDVMRGPSNIMNVLADKTGEQLYQSQNDQRTLRNAARRWAKNEGLDVAPPALTYGEFRKSANAPVFEGINDALLSGDAAKAREIADDFINSAADKKKAEKAVIASVKGKHPFRAAQYASDKYQKEFLTWTKTHLSEQDQEQINRVIKLYEDTAKEARLLTGSRGRPLPSE